MKKIFATIVLCVVAFGMYAQNVPSGYIDLGLPSGTIWKKANEAGLMTTDQAFGRYFRNLPTEEQWQELKSVCEWSWTGNGYRVIGPNRNILFLPAAGYLKCSGNEKGAGVIGYYHSNTSVDEYQTWALMFGEEGIYIDVLRRCEAKSVRLVYNGY